MLRKLSVSLAVTALLLLISIPALSAAFQKMKLRNGLTVIIIEDHSTDLVAVDVWVNAGSRNETKENNGISHMIEHLAFAGSEQYKSGDLDIIAESLGANLDAHTTRDWARFSTSASSRYFQKAAELLAEAVVHPIFPDAAIQKEKMIILDEIARKQSNTRQSCEDRMWNAVYGSHPYALPIEGTPDSIKTLTRQQIQEYYNSLYAADNMVVVIVGDIDASTAIQTLGKLFIDLPKNAKTHTLPDPVMPSTYTEKTIDVQGKSGCVVIGFVGPAASEYTDVCAMDVLLAYVGYGYRSWMNEELVRNSSLATDASADFLTHKFPGLISLTVECRNSSLSTISDTLKAKISTICSDGITDSDIERAKRSLLGQFAFQNETFDGKANTYGFYDRISDAEFGDTYVERIQSITNDDIKRVAQKYMDMKHATVIIAKAKE